MLRIGQVEVTAQNNKYTDGSVAGGVPATRLRAAAFNALQEEVAGVVEGGGLDLDPDDSGQLLKALKLLFAEKTESLGALAALVGADNKMPYFTGTDKAALTALTAFARELLAQNDAAGVLTKLGLGEVAKLPPPKFTTGAGYTLFQSPFMDGETLSWFSTLTMAVTPGALGNNSTLSISFPIAFSSSVGGAISDTAGLAASGTGSQDLGMDITGINETGVTIMSRWQSRPADFSQIRFVITGVIDG